MVRQNPARQSPRSNPTRSTTLVRHGVRLALFMVALAIVFAPAPDQKPQTVYAAEGPTVQIGGALAPGGAQTDLNPIFNRAAATYNVPVDLLKAICYLQTGWNTANQEPDDIPTYGLMGLTAEPAGTTLARAVALTGADEQAVKFDPAANIMGAAAVLRELADKQAQNGHAVTGMLRDWYSVVASYGGMTDPMVARSYAFSVFQVISKGTRGVTPQGEQVGVAARGDLNLPDKNDPLVAQPDSTDYPVAHWVAANYSNYQAGREYGPLNFIVIHDTEGTYQSAINWFQNAASQVSAHFVIRSSDGDVTQMVRNADTAYHAGNWDYNVRAIGVEHEGYMSDPSRWYTSVMYNSSVNLVRSLAEQYSIKKDRAHIIGHIDVPNQRAPAHVDPGPGWNWDTYLAAIRRDSAAVARVDNTDAGFAANGSGWQTFGNGYNNSSTLMVPSTTSSPNAAGTWSANLPASGGYDVYAYIPYVNNHNAETTSARYIVYTQNGAVQVVASQKALTDIGNGQSEWMHLGSFNFGSGVARVTLSNQAADSGKNVWFDAMMWIPLGSVAPAPTVVAPTSTPVPTNTPVPVVPPTATATPGPCGMSFSDLPDSDWSYNYVAQLYCQGVLGGYSDGTFRPGTTVTRGQLAKMLVLAKGWAVTSPPQPTFSDVGADSPFYVFVETAVGHQIITGYSDGTFKPNSTVTRAQFSKMLALTNDWLLAYPPTSSFNDVGSDNWAFGFIETAKARGVLSGYADGSFRPGATTTRAQTAKILFFAFPNTQ